MFDYSLVVQSAISSFNNAALAVPDFFWAAVLALPIFIAVWAFAPKINEWIGKNKLIIPTIIIVVLFIWTLSHESFASLRDFSYAGTLTAIALCGMSAFLSRRYYAAGVRITDLFSNMRDKWRCIINYMMPAALVIIAGACGEWTIDGIALQAGAVAIGIAAGYMLNRRRALPANTDFIVAAVITILGYGMVMQPEFFRFGQLGNLSFVHIIFAAIFALIAMYFFATHLVKPKDKGTATAYKRWRIMWIVLLALLFILFFITESPIVYAAFMVCAFFAAMMHARHLARPDKNNKLVLPILIGAFGIIATVPLLVCVAILQIRERLL